jgi:hypothetical protein
MKRGILKLEHGRAIVIGPAELVNLIKRIPLITSDPKEQHQLYNKVVSDYYVDCSVTGEPIRVSDLRYWNVEKSEVYKSPEVMPLYDRYPENDPVQCRDKKN